MRIHYRRPPDRVTVFEQRRLHQDATAIVTYSEHASISRDVIVNGVTVLEIGAPVLWFTFPGKAYDIGRFHLRDGSFTGLYVNVITAVEFRTPTEWDTTDLFLDLWLAANGGAPIMLDESELEEALAADWINEQTAQAARQEADQLMAQWRAGSWPPPVVNQWTLERAGWQANRPND